MNKTGKRADKTEVVGIKNAKSAEGIPIMHGESRLRKDIERYTITCDDCDGVGRYDDRGEIICEDCGLVISDKDAGRYSYSIYLGQNVDAEDTDPAPKPSGEELLRQQSSAPKFG